MNFCKLKSSELFEYVSYFVQNIDCGYMLRRGGSYRRVPTINVLDHLGRSVVYAHFSKIFFSETAWPIKLKFYVEHPWVGVTKV